MTYKRMMSGVGGGGTSVLFFKKQAKANPIHRRKAFGINNFANASVKVISIYASSAIVYEINYISNPYRKNHEM